MITDSNSKLPSDSTPLDRDLLLAENDRLRALLQDQLELRGSKWIRMLAAARRTGAPSPFPMESVHGEDISGRR